jgi:hypothetical protein
VNVHAVLRQCALDLLDTEPHVTVEHVVNCAYQHHGEAFVEEQERMVLASARNAVARLMRDLAENENEQQTFAGFGGLPSAIAVQTDTGTYYVRSDKAKWEELLAGRQVRERNVELAQKRLDAYDEALNTLRPHMEDTGRTVAEAVRSLSEAA